VQYGTVSMSMSYGKKIRGLRRGDTGAVWGWRKKVKVA
jgi:hypothetical protein